jgi:hypothetical protein
MLPLSPSQGFKKAGLKRQHLFTPRLRQLAGFLSSATCLLSTRGDQEETGGRRERRSFINPLPERVEQETIPEGGLRAPPLSLELFTQYPVPETGRTKYQTALLGSPPVPLTRAQSSHGKCKFRQQAVAVPPHSPPAARPCMAVLLSTRFTEAVSFCGGLGQGSYLTCVCVLAQYQTVSPHRTGLCDPWCRAPCLLNE